ncbi:MAG: phage portal protein [Nitrospira sp.]|nr:phage portal protein [Nitrospira sp.]
MSWKDWLPTLAWKQTSTARAILLQTTPGLPVWPRRNYEAFAREGYSNSAIVYACVNEIAKAMGGLHWLVQIRRGGQWRELDEHPLLTLLARPNPMQGGGRFFETMTGHLMISGNAYIERVGPGTGQGRIGQAPRELYALRPDRMTVVPGDQTNLVARYEYRAGGAIVPIPTPLILHEKLFDPLDDWYGLSPLQVLAKAVDTDNIAIAWNYTLIKKGARPSGGLVVPQNLNDTQYARLQKQIDEQTGDEMAGHPMLLEGGMEWKEMGLSPRDMDWIESRKMTKHDIAMAYGVMAELIGLKDATYENRREARRAFYSETVLPLADFLRDDLSNWLVPLFGDRLKLDYDRDAIDALQEDREKLWTRVQSADWLTVNEKRIATGYDEYPDGDVLLVPIGKVPLSEAGQTGADFSQVQAQDAGQQAAQKAVPSSHTGVADRRELEWKARVLQFLPIEKRYVTALGVYFTAQRDEVLARLARSSGLSGLSRLSGANNKTDKIDQRDKKDVDEILFELDAQTNKLREVSKPYFDEAVKRGGEALWAEVGASGGFTPQSPGVRTQIDFQLRQLAGIPERVRQRVEQEIAAGLSADESPAEIAARISGLYHHLAGARAQTIARTETARAYNETRWAAMRQLGIERAEWLTARDEHVRLDPFDHQIDGEVRRLGEPFTNGLRFPNDPTGAPGNVINCRCVAIPVGGTR